jgi:hypothetical protein
MPAQENVTWVPSRPSFIATADSVQEGGFGWPAALGPVKQQTSDK